MIIAGKEVNGFEEDQMLNDLCVKYYIILKDFESRKFPPTERNFITRFEKDYNTKMTVEEFLELKDFAINDYPHIIPEDIQRDFEAGRLTKVKL